MNILIALAVTVSTYIVQSDYCHRWATSEIQAVATFVQGVRFQAPTLGWSELIADTPCLASLREEVAVSVNLRRPRDYLIR
jgi:hypothetical protein